MKSGDSNCNRCVGTNMVIGLFTVVPNRVVCRDGRLICQYAPNQLELVGFFRTVCRD